MHQLSNMSKIRNFNRRLAALQCAFLGVAFSELSQNRKKSLIILLIALQAQQHEVLFASLPELWLCSTRFVSAELRLCSPSFASGERGLFRFASRIAPREYAVCFA